MPLNHKCLNFSGCVKNFVITAALGLGAHTALGQNEQTKQPTEANPSEQQITPQPKQNAEKEPLPPSEPPLISNHKYQQGNLAQLLSTPETVWLDSNDGRFLALWQPDLSGTPKGAVIIVPGPGASPVEKALLHELRDTLSLHGWSSLTLHPVREPGIKIPRRPEQPLVATASPGPDNLPPHEASQDAPENPLVPPAPEAKEDETQVVFDGTTTPAEPPAAPPAEQTTYFWAEASSDTFTRLNTAITWLNTKGQYNLVLAGSGTGAWLCLTYLQETGASGQQAVKIQKNAQQARITRAIQALILLDIRPPSGTLEPPPASDPTLPVLDIYTTNYGAAKAKAQLRKTIAKRDGVEIYVQRYHPPQTVVSNEGRTTKTVRGFLSRHVSGVEMN